MDLPIVARAALIVVFATSGVYCLLRCVRWSRRPSCHAGGSAHDTHGRVSDLTQVAMSGAMVAMLATGFSGDRWGVQLTVFGVAAGWFLTRALPRVGRQARTGLVNHAVMMGGMCWMSFTMTSASSMDMPGMTAAVGPSAVTSLAIAGYLVAAAVWWGRRSLVAARTGGLFGVTGVTTCHAVTSAAMAALLVLSVQL